MIQNEFIISEAKRRLSRWTRAWFQILFESNRDIQNVIKEETLEFFIFSNGDLTRCIETGEQTILHAINEMKSLSSVKFRH